jgi:hypothetical protein
MRLLCYDYLDTDAVTKDQLAAYSEWFTSVPMGVRYFVREDRVAMLLLITNQLYRQRAHDQIL